MNFGGVEVKKSMLTHPQFDDRLGVFASRDYKKGESVIIWNLRILTLEEYERLPEGEREQFTHKRDGTIYLYPEPERHVNRSKNPNVASDFRSNSDVALRNIRKGEELTILDTTKEDS